MQDLLGEHQDAVVARDRLPGYAARDHAAGRDTFGHGVLWAAQRDAAARTGAPHRLSGPLSRTTRRELTHW